MDSFSKVTKMCLSYYLFFKLYYTQCYLFLFFEKHQIRAIIGIVCDLGILKSYVNWWVVMNMFFFIGHKEWEEIKVIAKIPKCGYDSLIQIVVESNYLLIFFILFYFIFFFWETNQTTSTSKVSAPLGLSYKRFSFVWLESLKIWKQLYTCYLFRRIFVC